MSMHAPTIQHAPSAFRIPPVQKFGSRIFLPLVLAAAAAILAAGFGLYHATERSDAIAVERQTRETQQAISSTLDELSQAQEVVAVWDDPFQQLRKPELDWAWLDENVGVWLWELFLHEQVYALDVNDAPIYGVIDGVRVEASQFAEVAPYLTPLIDRVRGRVPGENTVHERLRDQPLHPDNTVRTSGEATHATGLVNIAGRPAAASVMLIVPHTAELYPPAGTEQLAVSIRFLDGSLLKELSKRNLIEAPRFSRVLDTAPGEHGFLVKSDRGEDIGYFIWRPELPGTGVMRSVIPTAAFAMVIILLVMGVLAFWLYRSMEVQKETIIELQASEAQAQHLAFHDTLTGLPNRAKFNDRLEKALLRARQGETFAVLLLDLDRFKHVNDTLGHLAGDTLIREFAARLTRIIDEEDTAARLGGDEFAILRHKVTSYSDIEALCQRLLGAVRNPFELLGNSAFVGVSIGVTMAPEAGCERVDLLRKADIALYRAKAEGRDRYCLFTPSMDDSVKMRSAIEEELRAALATGNGLKVHYQPQVAGPDGTIVGLEALVRWQHPTLGLVAPDRFIGVAEGAGLIGQLGEWVLRQACAASLRWPDLFIAVNLSPAQFRTAGFADRVIDIVEDCGADPRRIELEVTEGVLLDDSEAIREALAALREAGFTIALDDFGTGYSSFSYLRRFEVDKIKIDRSFVQHLGHAVDSAAIISAVLTLGHAMGLTVTAEGVETPEQYDFLEAAGCNAMQGFLFSKPLPEDEINRLLTVKPEAADKPVVRGAA
jgi:diguanylate cyclase (GGDEF)-like protein